jgi:hypothetical protein
MPVIEYPRTIQSPRTRPQAIPVAKMSEHSKRSGLCALRDTCRSRLCQFTNSDCPGSRKGKLKCPL